MPNKLIVISEISDMEGNPASTPMVNALSSRIDTVIKEMGLSAQITISADNPSATTGGKDRRKKRAGVHARRRRKDSIQPNPLTAVKGEDPLKSQGAIGGDAS